MDRHHHPAPVRHNHACASVRDSHRIHGRYATDWRSSAGGQARVRTGGSLTRHLLPYEDVKRGDIIVFRYPIDIRQTFVKRVMGVPGDHIRMVNKRVFLNGHPLNEPYKYNKTEYIDSYRDNFPGEPNVNLYA